MCVLYMYLLGIGTTTHLFQITASFCLRIWLFGWWKYPIFIVSVKYYVDGDFILKNRFSLRFRILISKVLTKKGTNERK